MEHDVERLRRAINEARKVHDEPTIKALGDMLFEATGVHEPEFAPVESSGNPKLDSLRRALVQAIAARDEPSETSLRAMIKDIEGEPLPEVNIELTEEEPIENPFAPPEVLAELAELSPFVAEDYEDDTVSREELEESLELDEEDVLIEDLMKDKLRATQIAALQKVGIATEEDAIEYIYNDGGDAMSALLGIKGISDKSANIILDTLCYEA